MPKITTRHKEIKAWMESNKEKPQIIIDDSQVGIDPVGLRIDFPGKDDDVFLNRKEQ